MPAKCVYVKSTLCIYFLSPLKKTPAVTLTQELIPLLSFGLK